MSYGFTITSKGSALLAKLLAGEQLKLTRVMVGKGKLPDDVNPMSLTDLIAPVAQATSDIPVVSENTVSFMVEYRNNLNGGLKEGFWLNEFSVYAADPEEGEIMLYYATLGEFPRYISAYSKDRYVDSQRFPVTIALTSELKADITYRPLASVTAEDLNKHVWTPGAHDADHIAYSNPDLPEIKTVQQMLDSQNENKMNKSGGDFTGPVTINGNNVLTGYDKGRSLTLYVAVTGNDQSGDGSYEKPFATVPAAMSFALKHFNITTLVIVLKSGTYTTGTTFAIDIPNMKITVKGESGNAGDVLIVKPISASYAFQFVGAPLISIQNISFDATGNTSTVTPPLLQLNHCNFEASNCVFNKTSGNNNTGILAVYSVGVVSSCTFNSQTNAIYAYICSSIYSYNNLGNENSNVLTSSSGIIYKRGTQPSGTTAEVKSYGGQIFS